MRHLRTLLTTRSILLIAVGLLGLLGLPAAALADSISPSTFLAAGPTGFTATVRKTVTVNAGTPTTQADIFFLADTTGSMGGAIAAVRTSATGLMTTLSGLGNIQFGVGEYKDVGDVFVYRLNQNITASIPAAQTGINAWGASGGGDEPEGQMFALQQAANTTSWRAGSKRVLVWFGDAPGHDPSSGGATEASATAALLANGVQVEAISVGANRLDLTGQATRITAATGGTLFSGIAQDAIVAAITAALESAFANYSSVCLAADGNLPNVDVTTDPCITGRFDRSIDRTFEFDATFRDLVPGDHSFVIHALVDGGIVATESDRIISRGIPEPASLLLVGAGLLGLAAASRGLRRRK